MRVLGRKLTATCDYEIPSSPEEKIPSFVMLFRVVENRLQKITTS